MVFLAMKANTLSWFLSAVQKDILKKIYIIRDIDSLMGMLEVIDKYEIQASQKTTRSNPEYCFFFKYMYHGVRSKFPKS